MFSVTGRNCIGQYTFAHEVGHNFGCNHDKGTTNACGGGINYGFREPTGAWRSVLSYGCTGGQCDAYAGSGSCSRVPQFSNPNDDYNGFTAGAAAGSAIGETNNAQHINNVRVTMAQHRATVPPCTVDSDCDDASPCTTDTCTNNVCIYTPIQCDDGLFCNGLETCNESTGQCQGGAAPQCNDGNSVSKMSQAAP